MLVRTYIVTVAPSSSLFLRAICVTRYKQFLDQVLSVELKFVFLRTDAHLKRIPKTCL